MFAKQTNAVSEIGHKLSFEAVLADIIALLPQGRFQNEQAISQGIVLPILRELAKDNPISLERRDKTGQCHQWN
jgi:hypothetical protein